ncbi:MAG: DUF4250 domain-containing protein [Lachnospiraceae bacterium]
MLPKDPVMLLSVVNTKLRDVYQSLDQMCEDLDVDKNELITKLEAISYKYDLEQNQFI